MKSRSWEVLWTPKDPIAPLEDVPFLGDNLKYDLGPFLSYPLRTGRIQIIPPNKSLDETSEFTRIQVLESSETLEPHLQAWFFFGLLSEFIGINRSDAQISSDSLVDPMVPTLYREFVYEKDGKKWLTTTRLFELILETIQKPGTLKDANGEINQRWVHMGICLKYVNTFLVQGCPTDFDHRIRYSLAAVGECLTYVVNKIYEFTGFKQFLGTNFSKGFLSPTVCKTMIEKGGWCPSDISRILAHFDSLHTYHLLSKMNRTGAGRDHSTCSDSKCQADQINAKDYIASHAEIGCQCYPMLSQGEETLLRVLRNSSSYPLLRITTYPGEGDKVSIDIDIVDWTVTSKYVAISHVWADGLGNPHSNGLYQCQYERLHNMAQDMLQDSEQLPDSTSSTKSSGNTKKSYIWIDTLCCPAKPGEGKDLALLKMQEVYQKAEKTLVLDKGLYSVSTEGMDVFEILSRIFTCGWMRRLWTLQEAALSKSLWFRFSNSTFSLDELLTDLTNIVPKRIPYRGLIFDIVKENQMMRIFYKQLGTPSSASITPESPDITYLDHALKHRSVSVPSDEPLCIATLMGFDSSLIVPVPPTSRMRQIWHLLTQANRVPATIIFLIGERLSETGWRWAPKTLIGTKGNVRDLRTRRLLLRNPQMARATPHGLRVNFAGVRFSLRAYDDGLPRHPWASGFPQVPESSVLFRNRAGHWFRLSDNHSIGPDAGDYYTYSASEIAAWRAAGSHPLHELLASGRGAVVFAPARNIGWDGALVRLEDHDVEEEGALSVHLLSSVRVMPLPPSEFVVWSTIERIATKLRAEEVTRQVVECQDSQSEAFKEAISKVTVRMKEEMQVAIDADPVFAKACKDSIEDDILPYMWRYVAEWYREDFFGEFLLEGQTWVVD